MEGRASTSHSCCNPATQPNNLTTQPYPTPPRPPPPPEPVQAKHLSAILAALLPIASKPGKDASRQEAAADALEKVRWAGVGVPLCM